MTLWVPWEIIGIEGKTAHLKRGEYKLKAKLLESDYSVGDFVNVQGGMIINKISKKEATEHRNLWKNLL